MPAPPMPLEIAEEARFPITEAPSSIAVLIHGRVWLVPAGLRADFARRVLPLAAEPQTRGLIHLMHMQTDFMDNGNYP